MTCKTKEKLKEAEVLIETLRVALNDWTHTYAPEFCHEHTVKESRDRVEKNGTLYYIADLLEQIDSFKGKKE
jgi:hypothetical protein